jgi:hypothetical protein
LGEITIRQPQARGVQGCLWRKEDSGHQTRNRLLWLFIVGGSVRLDEQQGSQNLALRLATGSVRTQEFDMGLCTVMVLSAQIVLCTTATMAQDRFAPPKTGPEVKRLSVFVGKWTAEGELK